MQNTVTFVISSLSSGGAEKVVSVMANYWAGKGWGITVLTLDNGKHPPFFSLHPSIVHRSLHLSGVSSNIIKGLIKNIKRLLVLRWAIKESSPEFVISFMDQTNILTILATIGLGLPVIVSERTDPNHHSIGRFWAILRTWIYPYAYCIVVQSRRVLNYFPVPIRRRAKVIPNPVLLPKENIKRDKKKDKKGKLIISMGRMGPEKGFDLLIKAFAQIAKRYPAWSLRILGDGPERSSLQRLCERLGLCGRVDFPGITNTPADALKNGDLFVLSSRYEGFPNVLCEAMACGLPVVSFDCPSGPGEIIRQGVNGILVPPEDIDALASGIETLIKNENHRIRLGQRAKEIVNRFSLDRVMEQWEAIFIEASARTGKRSVCF